MSEFDTVTVILPDGSHGDRRVSHSEQDSETGMMISVPETRDDERAERLFGYPK